MELPHDLLRSALEEYIAFGPQTVRSPEDRLASRLPHHQPADRRAALIVAREAVAAAEELAREYADGRRTQASVSETLLRRFNWLIDPALPQRQSWWRQLLTHGTTRAQPDLVTRLANFGFHLVIM